MAVTAPELKLRLKTSIVADLEAEHPVPVFEQGDCGTVSDPSADGDPE